MNIRYVPISVVVLVLIGLKLLIIGVYDSGLYLYNIPVVIPVDICMPDSVLYTVYKRSTSYIVNIRLFLRYYLQPHVYYLYKVPIIMMI